MSTIPMVHSSGPSAPRASPCVTARDLPYTSRSNSLIRSPLLVTSPVVVPGQNPSIHPTPSIGFPVARFADPAPPLVLHARRKAGCQVVRISCRCSSRFDRASSSCRFGCQLTCLCGKKRRTPCRRQPAPHRAQSKSERVPSRLNLFRYPLVDFQAVSCLLTHTARRFRPTVGRVIRPSRLVGSLDLGNVNTILVAGEGQKIREDLLVLAIHAH